MFLVVTCYYLPSDNNDVFLIVSKQLTNFEEWDWVVKNNKIVLQYLVVGKVLR